MKKIIWTVFLILFATSAFAQPNTFPTAGNVGIGTTNPSVQLTTAGATGKVVSFANDAQPTDQAYGAFGVRAIFGYNGTTTNAVVQGISGKGIEFNVNNNTFGLGQAMVIAISGNVGIGTLSPQNKLDVNGTIHSKRVNVDLAGWPDFVFKQAYSLPTLNEVKSYVEKNQHLPGIPSEQEMVKNGLNVGEMNKLLMQKVEELTLYLIEKDRQLSEQKQLNDSFQRQLAELAKQVELLKQTKEK